MNKKRHKKQLKKAIEDSASRLFKDSGRLTVPKLYLTERQYESDPDGWHDVLRQRGLPEDAIVIVPEVFRDK